MAERLLIQITKDVFFYRGQGVFLRLVTPRLRVDFFFFLVARLVVRLGLFDLRATCDVDRRLHFTSATRHLGAQNLNGAVQVF